MIVIRDGVQVADYPASYGLESDPRRITRAGTHVVMSKHESYEMSSDTYGYEGVVVPYAVRISNNGEFVHGYANSISAQGNRNVSHGCINLSPANAKLYFETALVGDPVEVVSSKPLTARDGDFYDWVVPWEEWLANSAV
jgi:lipoprotein-anchoring transpeptidase ErfK/SrfK